MKTFIYRLLLFVFVISLVVIVGFFLPVTPRASRTYLYGNILKDSLLQNIPAPRIILVGGSNLSFGINSKMIHDSLFRNPINTGINANIGIIYMMDNTIRYVEEGDVVIVSPEYEQFTSIAYGGEELLRTVTNYSVDKLKDLRNKQLLSISKYIVKYSLSKYRPIEYTQYRENKIYGVNSFNEFGDACGHWGLESTYFPVSYGGGKLPEDMYIFDQLDSFRNIIEAKGARLFVTFPGYQGSSFDNNIDFITTIADQFKRYEFNLLGTPTRYRIPDSLMFDTPYHLTKEGTDYRTSLLIEDLKSKL